MQKSSFSRAPKKAQLVLPPGTKPSIHNGQLLISTGLHELDEILGGGLAVGTILLVEEDKHTSYYSHLLRYFMSEGLAVKHKVQYINADIEFHSFLKRLPKNVTLEAQSQPKSTEEQDTPSEEGMKIAWQYQKYLDKEGPVTGRAPSINQSGSLQSKHVATFCHSYDLGRGASPEDISQVESVPVHTLQGYQDLYQKLFHTISSNFKSDTSSPPGERSILRLCISSLGSPLWPSSDPREVGSFLHSLRGLLRASLGVCVISLPTPSPFQRLAEQWSDAVVHFESFETSSAPVSEAFEAFDGQFRVKKLSPLNSLTPPRPETLQYLFKLRRRKLHLEIPHMGPAESRTSKERAADTSKSIGELLCAPSPSSQSSPLDF